MKNVVISFTSYPARINMVNRVIESLFRQREQVDEIILWLSIEEFPEKYNNLPENLTNLIGKNGFHIEWVKENLKSHKKYFYALQNSKDINITVDDDMYYSDTLVSTLMNSYRKYPYAISARGVRIIMKEGEQIIPYIAWESEVSEYIGIEKMDLCAIGVNGILYPPGCAKERWFDIPSIIKLAENQDDLWLKWNQIIDNIPVVYTGIIESDKVLENSQKTSLYFQNMYGGFNDISIHKLLENLKKNYKSVYKEWDSKLMQLNEFISEKRKYYRKQLEQIILQWEQLDIYICGAGNYAHILYKFLKTCGMDSKIKAFLITKKNPDSVNLNIKYIKDLEKQRAFGVICGVGSRYREEFRRELQQFELHKWVDINISGLERLLQLEEMKL